MAASFVGPKKEVPEYFDEKALLDGDVKYFDIDSVKRNTFGVSGA